MYRYAIAAVAILIISLNANGQTYSTGHEDKKVDVNFTELANYYKAYPEPLIRKPFFNEQDEEEGVRPEPQEPDPSLVHMIKRNPARMAPGSALPASMPVSPAPEDTFLSTVTNGTAIPPDTHGAVDSNYCVTTINTEVHIQTRTGANVSSISLDGWWTSLLTHGDGSFDPRVHYDPHYNRWIMVCDAYGQTANSQIMVAVSATSNPTGTWHMYSVVVDGTGANWLDFPCVGFNNQWIVVSGNLYSNSSGRANGSVLYVFNYASIMAGTGAPYTKITETRDFTICPAETYDATQQSMFLLENSSGNSGNKLKLWKITGAVGSPVIATVGYPAATENWQGGSFSNLAQQLGTTNLVEANDDRIFHIVYRNNYIWAAHTVFLPDPGTVSRSSVMWWQIDTLANPIQNGLIDDPVTPTFFDFPSIAVNQNNDVLVGFGYLSANIHPSAGYALHLHTDANDSMRKPVVFRHGKSTYSVLDNSGDNRWGDYSNSCVDPVNNTNFWTIQESVVSTDNWDTWWADVSICPSIAAFTKATDTVVKFSNDTLTFAGTAAAGTTYSWSFGGGTAVPGTGAGPQAVKWTSDGWKVITLSVTVSGCTSTYTDSVFVKGTAGINELAVTDADIEIAPNPNDGSFNILLNNTVSRSASVKVADMQGRVVYAHEFDVANNNSFPVNTDNLAPGIYVVTINTGSAEIAKKVTIIR